MRLAVLTKEICVTPAKLLQENTDEWHRQDYGGKYQQDWREINDKQWSNRPKQNEERGE